ncbi:MAG: hypothetical protein E6X75_04355 [Enterococcus faecalis]|nr:hypothetical protein [Enterococcus faecalis]
MNDKIQKLIKKLAKECQKEDVGLSLAGTIVAIAAHSQYTLTKEKLEQSDCDCPKHRLLKEMYGIETETTTKNTHTFVTDDPNDLMDILSKIFQGEFK